MTSSSPRWRRPPVASRSGFEPLAISDHATTLTQDVEAVLDSPLIPDGTIVAGLVYDIHSGRLRTVVDPQPR